ncbi:MAG: L,D-transpeptidase [Pseudomonadota bacterium]
MAMRFWSTFGCVAALMVSMIVGAEPASATARWSNGAPVFQSDVDRARKARERIRAKRRKSYQTKYPRFMTGGGKPKIEPEAPKIVSLSKPMAPGQIIIDTKARRLFFTLAGNRAYAYPISVGRKGFTWYGTKKVTRMASWPTWTPPAEMRRREPYLPVTMSGGIRNPLGAKALYLGSSLYRIHGTNNPKTIGRAASSGCFRMMNKHVLHLASVSSVGTRVSVRRSFPHISQMPSLASLLGL